MKLNDETLRFIHEHCKDDVRNLALQAPKYPGVDMPVALTQIAGRENTILVCRRRHSISPPLVLRAMFLGSYGTIQSIYHSGVFLRHTGRLNRRVRHRLCFSFSEIPSCHLCGTAGGSLRNCFA